MLNTEQTKEFKEELEKTKAGLLAQIKDLESPVDFGDDIDHLDEEADEAEEFGNRLSVTKALKERLQNVEAGLLKLSESRYGQCEKCGKEISWELLKIDPESRYCQACKASA